MTNDNPQEAGEDTPEPDSFRDRLRRAQAQMADDKIPKANLPDVPEPTPAAMDTQVALPTVPTTKTPLSSSQSEKMNRKVDRATRQILRRIQAHLLNAHVGLGAQHEVVGLVEVLYHPQNTIGSLNYITPRQRTAWIALDHLRQGVDYMTERNRTPRVLYIEGLMPPLFTRNLTQLDMTLETEVPLMVYTTESFNGQPPPALEPPKPPYDIRLETAQDLRDVEVWWYVWQNAYYDVLTLGVEPLFVGRDLAAVRMGKQIDIIAYRENFPFGVARMTIHEDTAHLVSVAVFKEWRTDTIMKLIHQTAVNEAVKRGCTLIFAPGETEYERRISRDVGFMDFGSIVCYAAQNSNADPSTHDNEQKLAQPLLDFRP